MSGRNQLLFGHHENEGSDNNVIIALSGYTLISSSMVIICRQANNNGELTRVKTSRKWRIRHNIDSSSARVAISQRPSQIPSSTHTLHAQNQRRLLWDPTTTYRTPPSNHALHTFWLAVAAHSLRPFWDSTSSSHVLASKNWRPIGRVRYRYSRRYNLSLSCTLKCRLVDSNA